MPCPRCHVAGGPTDLDEALPPMHHLTRPQSSRILGFVSTPCPECGAEVEHVPGSFFCPECLGGPFHA